MSLELAITVDSSSIVTALERIRAETGQVLDQDIGDAARHALSLMRDLINTGGRSGRIYKRGKGRTHQASAPGEPPKTDLGGLSASLGFDHLGPGRYVVGSTVSYAPLLEVVLNRPFFERSVVATGAWLEARLDESLRRLTQP